MATFAATSAACSLASSASPLMAGGLSAKLPSASSPRPLAPSLAIRASLASDKTPERNSRRALFFGAAIASALALSSLAPSDHDAALAAEEKKKKNKCPTICVQTPTASCCYGYGS